VCGWDLLCDANGMPKAAHPACSIGISDPLAGQVAHFTMIDAVINGWMLQ
jgi:hypothetical protein